MERADNQDRSKVAITLAHLVRATDVLFSSPGKTLGFLDMGANDPEGKGIVPHMRHQEIKHLQRVKYIQPVKPSTQSRGQHYRFTAKGREAYERAVDEFAKRVGEYCNPQDIELLTEITQTGRK